MKAAAIQARGLGKSYGRTPVLRDVNLDIESGCGAAVVGANGAGKSTLIRLLAGLGTPSAGAALLFGEPARSLDPALRRRVGLLTHQSMLYPNLTARENLEFYAVLYGVERPRDSANEWLERVTLSAAAETRVRGFSRGMEQRLAVARAMIARPDVLMLDEPFAALDADGVAVAASLMREAMMRGCAVLASAHSPAALEELGFAVLSLNRGRLMRAESSPGLRSAERSPIVRQLS